MICTKDEFARKYGISQTFATLLIDRVNAPRVNDAKPYYYYVSRAYLEQIILFLKTRKRSKDLLNKLEKELLKEEE